MTNANIYHFALVLIVSIIASIALNLWLDSGCSLQGIITTHGKVCLK